MSRPIDLTALRAYFQSFARFQRDARLYLLSSALSGVTVGIILVLYNLYLVALGYTTDFIGLLLFIGTLGGGLAIFPAGACIDRFGGRLILIGASFLIGVAGAGQMLLRAPVPLLVSTFIVGIGGAFILVVNAPFLTIHSSPVERPQLFSLNIMVTLATTVLGEFLGGVLPHWLLGLSWVSVPLPPALNWLLVSDPVARSYQVSLLLSGVIALPSFIPLFLMSDDRPVQPAPFRLPGRLRKLFVRPDPSRADVSSTSLSKSIHLELSSFKLKRLAGNVRALLATALATLIAVWALIGLGAGLFIPYFNIFFVKHLGASSALFGLIDGCANLLNALSLLLAPWLALRIGRVATIIVPRLLALPIMLLIGLTAYLPLAAVLYPIRQGLMDMSQGILQLFSMEAVSQEHRGLANSSYQVAYQVAWACSAPVGGLIIQYFGFSPAFVGAAILYALAFLLLWLRFGRGQAHNDEKATELPIEALPPV